MNSLAFQMLQIILLICLCLFRTIPYLLTILGVFYSYIQCFQVRAEMEWRSQEVADWAPSVWLWLLKEVQDGVENEQVEFGGMQQQVL